MRRLTRQLLEKSEAAFVLSLDVYNSVSKAYRTEAFSILMSNAWELLLKAKLYQDSNGRKTSIFLKKKIGQKRETVSLDFCLKKIFPDQKDPIRSNVEFTSEVRNNAAHLIIEEFVPLYSRVFQRNVLNYVEKYEEWFGKDPTSNMNPGILALIIDENEIIDLQVLKKRFAREDISELEKIHSLFQDLEKLGEKATFTIEHKFVIEKNPKNADYIFTKGRSGKEVAIIEKPKDIDREFPYIQKIAVEVISDSIEHTGYGFGPYDFQSYITVKGYNKDNNSYHWKTKFNPSRQYSQKLIDEIIKLMLNSPGKIDDIKMKYGEIMKQKRKGVLAKKPK